MTKPRLPVDVKAGDLCDKNGVPIYPGDLLKSFSFRAALRRQKIYMYHCVILNNGVMEMVPHSELHKPDGGRCWLHTMADQKGVVNAEVIASHGDPWFPERKRRKVA
jgi:hypothetical protein